MLNSATKEKKPDQRRYMRLKTIRVSNFDQLYLSTFAGRKCITPITRGVLVFYIVHGARHCLKDPNCIRRVATLLEKGFLGFSGPFVSCL